MGDNSTNEIRRLKEENTKLENELKKLQEILQHVEDVYFELGLDGTILDVSPSIYEFYRYNRDEVIGTSIECICTNSSDKELLLKEIKSKGKVKNYIILLIDKDNNQKKAVISASLIVDQLGKPHKIAGILRDITEVEQVNKDLRWLRRAIEHIPVSIIITDTHGNIEYSNPFFTKVTGYTREEIFRKNPSILKSGKHDDKFYNKLWKTISDGKIWEGVFLNKQKDGSLFWEQARISPIKNKYGKIINYIGIKEDITKQVEDADEIMRLKSFNENILNTMKEGILVEDKDGTILYSNPSFHDMSGYSADELKGKNWQMVVPKECYAVIEEANIRRENLKSDSYEIKIQNKKGKLIPVLVSGSPILAKNEYSGLVAVFTDISRLKKHEKKIKKALKKAEVSDKLKSSFLANMSHEIRTPMNAILGFADILRNERNLDEDVRDEYFSIIENKGNELLQIISDIIDISKIESRIIDINNHKFEVNSFLQGIHSSLIKEAGYDESKVKIKLSLPEDTDKFQLTTDKYRLNQILTNLINNSKKFTEKGEIVFGYKLLPENLEFFVKDTGPGISDKNKKIIFDRFRQADDNYTRSFGGTGLGLNICKNLINLMGGDIRVESELNKGATFYFTIPQK